MNEITTELNDALTKVKALSYLKYEIPEDLSIEVMRLIYFYNQELKIYNNRTIK